MFSRAPIDIDAKAAPFRRLSGIRMLAGARRGHASVAYARHQLYVAHDRRSREDVVIKVTSKPGIVYEQDLTNEIASLSTINQQRPDAPYFPVLRDHGRLRDGRIYLILSQFAEWPLAAVLDAERIPTRLVAHLRTTIEVANALAELHALQIWHVDLNPMNILCRWESGKPVVRIVDFESSYEVARHSTGVFYNPPTTCGYSAPEVVRQVPDARSDLFSLGAVLYTMLAGYDWTWTPDVARSVAADPEVAPDLKEILVPVLDADPRRRPSSVTEWRAALDAYLAPMWPGRSS